MNFDDKKTTDRCLQRRNPGYRSLGDSPTTARTREETSRGPLDHLPERELRLQGRAQEADGLLADVLHRPALRLSPGLGLPDGSVLAPLHPDPSFHRDHPPVRAIALLPEVPAETGGQRLAASFINNERCRSAV